MGSGGRGFDTVVVGAGSAGCVLAARLSADPSRRVLVAEAGPDDPPDAVPEALRLLSKPVAWPYDWDDRVLTAGGRELFYGRGRGTGGSSATNGGVALRPEPEDVAGWPPGWGWDEVLPVLCRIERDLDFGHEPYHGSTGPVPVVRWREDDWSPLQAGFVAGALAVGAPWCPDHNAPGTSGVGPIPMNRDGRTRVSCRTAYLDPVRHRPNLVVRGDATVRRVLVRDGRATGVALDDGSEIAADEVVLCAGVVQSPVVLWRSGVGPAGSLGGLGVPVVADLAGVGAGLTDHMVVTFSTPVPPSAVPDGAPSIQTILRHSSSRGDRRHDLQLTPFARRHPDGRRELAISVALQLPDGTGRVTPTGPDLTGRARIEWSFASSPGNRARLADGWRSAVAVARASGLALDPAALDEVAAWSDERLDAHVLAEHTAFYHGVGTCRMGPDGDPGRVVDTACRVEGVGGLRVVDASVIPTVPRTNTNLAVIAVAERAADLMGAPPA